MAYINVYVFRKFLEKEAYKKLNYRFDNIKNEIGEQTSHFSSLISLKKMHF